MYRVMTMDAAYGISEDPTTTTAKIALPMTILMCVLPVITSLINIVIRYLNEKEIPTPVQFARSNGLKENDNNGDESWNSNQ